MPFTAEEFLALFERYNRAIWPLQVLTLVAAVVAVALVAFRPARRSTDAAVAGILAAFCTITGAGYFLLGFTRLTPAGYAFGAIFLGEAALLGHAALREGSLTFSGAPRWRAVLGAIVVVYGLVGYPLLGLLTRAPVRSPWMGVVPCPTTIFTLGLLLLSTSRTPARYLALPIVWATIGTMAAFRFGIREDLGMTAAAVVAAASLLEGVPGSRALDDGKPGA